MYNTYNAAAYRVRIPSEAGSALVLTKTRYEHLFCFLNFCLSASTVHFLWAERHAPDQIEHMRGFCRGHVAHEQGLSHVSQRDARSVLSCSPNTPQANLSVHTGAKQLFSQRQRQRSDSCTAVALHCCS